MTLNMTKVLFISGSPRKENNHKAVEYAISLCSDVEVDRFFCSEKKVAPCTACGYCKIHDEECAIKDDMQELRSKMSEADAIIVSSPVYFGNVSSQLKAIFDRTRPVRHEWKLKNKLGAGIACGGSRNGGQELTLTAIHSWMLIHGMKVVGDGEHFGGAIVGEFDEDEEGKKTVLNVVKGVMKELE